MSYCSPDQRVVGSGLSRRFRYSDFNSQRLDHPQFGQFESQPRPRAAEPNSAPDPPPNESCSRYSWWDILPPKLLYDMLKDDNCEGCLGNLSTALKTGNWSSFEGVSGIGQLAGCFIVALVVLVFIAGLGIILGIGGPFIYPFLNGIKDLFGGALSLGWSGIRWMLGLLWDGIGLVADTVGANHWLVALDGITGLLWAAAALAKSQLGLYQEWSESDFAVIFRFLDTPFELLNSAMGAISPVLGWISWFLLLPLECGLLVLSFLLGLPWELVKRVWKGVSGQSPSEL